MDIDLGEMLRDSRRISNQLHRRGSRALAEQGITDVQARVILYLLKHADTGASLTDVHRELHFSMAAASGLIKRLREKGYIRVEACALDERRKLFVLYAVPARFIERFSGDGLLIATPAGSTAYNYSLGGSIVDPRLKLLQVTPIAPMNTTATTVNRLKDTSPVKRPPIW